MQLAATNFFHIIFVISVGFVIFYVAPESMFPFIVVLVAKIATGITIIVVAVIAIFAFDRTIETRPFHSLQYLLPDSLREYAATVFESNFTSYLPQLYCSRASIFV